MDIKLCKFHPPAEYGITAGGGYDSSVPACVLIP